MLLAPAASKGQPAFLEAAALHTWWWEACHRVKWYMLASCSQTPADAMSGSKWRCNAPYSFAATIESGIGAMIARTGTSSRCSIGLTALASKLNRLACCRPCVATAPAAEMAALQRRSLP